MFHASDINAGYWGFENPFFSSKFQVYFAGLGCLRNVRAALCRGRLLKCCRCGRPGATIGCRVDRCPKTYHLVIGWFSRHIPPFKKYNTHFALEKADFVNCDQQLVTLYACLVYKRYAIRFIFQNAFAL